MSQEQEQRKASDILLNIEFLVQNLLKEIKLIGLNQKTMLDKLNTKLISPQIPAIKSIEIKNQERESRDIKNDINKPSSAIINQVTVVQRVFYPDGAPCVLANVRILDENKQEIKKTKIDASGKWNLKLSPGSYIVHIVKAPLADKKKPLIDRALPIVITGVAPIMELPDSRE